MIGLSLAAEYVELDIENHLFQILSPAIRSRIDRMVYNRRKRRLMPHQNATRMSFTESFNEFEDVFIVDSLPLEICKIAHGIP